MSRNIPSLEPSPQALFRYQAISQVLLRESWGEDRAEAVRKVAGQPLVGPDGELLRVSSRSLYRWLAAYQQGGFEALAPVDRSGAGSRAVSDELLAFFQDEKQADPRVSIPELIRRAREVGKIDPQQPLDRTTVWRRLRQAGVSTHRRKVVPHSPARRFAYPHRMELTLCDGKHFRAGAARRKRVALFFLDDATRFALNVVVGPSESASLFLRGLYQSILQYGFMRALYVDHGSGFIANDSIEVLRRLEVLFIHGRVAYPQGRGKVERLHRTASEQLLRLLDGRAEIDPDCSALELRLGHYLEQRYNRTPHESLGKDSPLERFQADPVSLRFAPSQPDLERAFVLHLRRRVSPDHVVSVGGVGYETPPGCAGDRPTLRRNLLDQTVQMLHEGRLVRLSPLDAQANARRPRSGSRPQPAESTSQPDPPASSAEMAFRRDLGPIVDDEGGFAEPDRKHKKQKPEQTRQEKENQEEEEPA